MGSDPTAATIVKLWDLRLDVSNIQTQIYFIKFIKTQKNNENITYIQTNEKIKLKKL